jgi:uncharacterized protein (DUF2147 family)
MQKNIPLLLALSLAGSAWAQAPSQEAGHAPKPSGLSPVGVWATHSDKTGEVQAHVAITERGGKLYGRIVQVLDPAAKPGELCSKCPDDRKNKPMATLEIIRGVDAQPEDGQWSGGRVLDPQEGREYRLKLIPQADGQSLAMRGYLGPFYRTQIWTRVPH